MKIMQSIIQSPSIQLCTCCFNKFHYYYANWFEDFLFFHDSVGGRLSQPFRLMGSGAAHHLWMMYLRCVVHQRWVAHVLCVAHLLWALPIVMLYQAFSLSSGWMHGLPGYRLYGPGGDIAVHFLWMTLIFPARKAFSLCRFAADRKATAKIPQAESLPHHNLGHRPKSGHRPRLVHCPMSGHRPKLQEKI